MKSYVITYNFTIFFFSLDDDYIFLRLLVALKGQGESLPQPKLGDGVFGFCASPVKRTGVVAKVSD